MYVLMKVPIGEMAVVADKTKRTAEFLDVNAIGLLSHIIDTVNGVAHFTLGFGGIDSKGTFRLDPGNAQRLANITINRNTDPQNTFDLLFMDRTGNSKSDYPRTFFEDLIKSLTPIAYKMIWGGTYPDMEVLMNGQLIFQPDHLKTA
jgi:hypothetical protein